MVSKDNFDKRWANRLEPTEEQTEAVVQECYRAAVKAIGAPSKDELAEVEAMALEVAKAFEAVRRTKRAADKKFEEEGQKAGDRICTDFDIEATHIVATALCAAYDDRLSAEDFHPYSATTVWVMPLVLASAAISSLSLVSTAFEDCSSVFSNLGLDARLLLKLHDAGAD